MRDLLPSDIKYFNTWVKRTKDCWLWTGPTSAKGYGEAKLGNFKDLAHKVSWVINCGTIPEGAKVLQLCGKQLCANPQHLALNVPETEPRTPHPLTKLPPKEAKQVVTLSKFLSYVEVRPDGVWEWQGCKDDAGYGVILDLAGERIRAHRLAWELFRGPIPDGLCVLHKLDLPYDVNPENLFLGTRADNNADMTAKGRNRNGQNGGYNFTPQQRLDMLRRFDDGETMASLAAEFNAPPRVIKRAIQRARRLLG